MSNVIGVDPVVSDNERMISIDNEEIEYLAARYRHQVSEDEWDGILNTAATALAGCPDPNGEPNVSTGLALGKVQSGKTLSYSTLIALAVNNGYRIVVVLAGTKVPLLEQTYSRLSADIVSANQHVIPFKNPNNTDVDVIRSVLHGTGSVLLVVLKNTSRLNTVSQILETPDLRGVPSLIIDDEGDEASLNTQFRRGRRSPVYTAILRLRNALSLHSYVAYTATPQANLLISGIDALSPDYGVLVEPGAGYCGGSVFFGETSDNFIRIIPSNEGDAAHAAVMTNSLKRAFAVFFAGAAVRSLRGSTGSHSMLVHTSVPRAEHSTLHQAIRMYIERCKEVLKLPHTDPASQDFYRLVEEAYEDLHTTVAEIPSLEEVKTQLSDEIWLTEVWMVNSLPLGRDPVSTPFRLKNNILVGGNMLGRGVTIPGLAVTYITREALQDTNADTLEQRARWFGYKQEYLDLCRIFLTRTLRNRYTELLRHEDDFWEALKRNERQQIPIRQWPRMLRLDVNGFLLRPTRQNVASFRQYRGLGWDVQTNVVLDSDIASQNLRIVREFMRDNPGERRSYGNVNHTVVPDFNPERLIIDFLSKIEVEGTEWEIKYVEEYIARLYIGNRLDGIDVLYINGGNIRLRNISSNGLIQPMQGHSPHRTPDDPDYYPGDRNIHNDRVQLQIHCVRVSGAGLESPVDTMALALFIPPFERYDLKLIVREA